MLEIELPTGVLNLTLIVVLIAVVPCVVVAGHVVVGMVAGNRHQRSAIDIARGQSVGNHALVNVGLEVLLHINSAHIVVLVKLLQRFLKLCVAYVCLVGVVGVGIAVTHEQHRTL